jgi:hypothetical protein
MTAHLDIASLDTMPLVAILRGLEPTEAVAVGEASKRIVPAVPPKVIPEPDVSSRTVWGASWLTLTSIRAV